MTQTEKPGSHRRNRAFCLVGAIGLEPNRRPNGDRHLDWRHAARCPLMPPYSPDSSLNSSPDGRFSRHIRLVLIDFTIGLLCATFHLSREKATPDWRPGTRRTAGRATTVMRLFCFAQHAPFLADRVGHPQGWAGPCPVRQPTRSAALSWRRGRQVSTPVTRSPPWLTPSTPCQFADSTSAALC